MSDYNSNLTSVGGLICQSFPESEGERSSITTKTHPLISTFNVYLKKC